MSEADIRIKTRISDEELERRWSAVRSAMTDQGIDFLIMQNTNQWFSGYVKWFTDVPAFNGFPTTVLFPRESDMTVINIGPKMDPASALTDLSTQNWAFRGVKNRFTAPSHGIAAHGIYAHACRLLGNDHFAHYLYHPKGDTPFLVYTH